MSNSPQNNPSEEGIEELGPNSAIGYMCLIDFDCELRMGALGGNGIYTSPKECFDLRGCIERCGMVEVEVRLRRVVPPSEYQNEE